ncbi:phage replication-related protein YjqB (UPF0714/DUF867 family) [Labrenzia sp. EL_13]|nr:phage replication-related protein YjqB (UPF0714/DUF867 family) [Labrenzia sp. EL_13]
MSREDKYASYKELSKTEKEGVDYNVTARPVTGSLIAIVAPHGGKIEPLTAELARSIAGDDYNFYAFEGEKQSNNLDLHITSHRFDEERALALIGPCKKVVTVHGLRGEAQSLQIGGRDEELRGRIDEALRAAGFDSQVVTEGQFGGMEPNNICNRGSTGKGVQLELHRGLRNAFRNDSVFYAKFVDTVRSAL